MAGSTSSRARDEHSDLARLNEMSDGPFWFGELEALVRSLIEAERDALNRLAERLYQKRVLFEHQVREIVGDARWRRVGLLDREFRTGGRRPK